MENPQEEPKQEKLEPIVYNIGDNIRIINPTENQPKLFTTHKVDNNFGVVYYYQLDGIEESIGFSYIKQEEPKQEKLEEAVDRLAKKYGYDVEGGKVADFVDGVIRGADWQAERMYSEEDMHKAYCAGSDFDMSCLKDEQYYMFKKWFEQFKKKQS
jgi:hypothetical protein